MAGSNDVTAVPRVRPPEDASERDSLIAMLDFLRATVVNKVAGLNDEQASSAPVPPSTLTPAGLVKHLTGTERFWFSIDFAGLDVPWPWTDEDMHGNFAIEPGDTLADVVAAYLRSCRSPCATPCCTWSRRPRGTADISICSASALTGRSASSSRQWVSPARTCSKIRFVSVSATSGLPLRLTTTKSRRFSVPVAAMCTRKSSGSSGRSAAKASM